MKTCTTLGCTNKHYAKGFCQKCYCAARYTENPKAKRDEARKWYWANRERARSAASARYSANPERERARTAARRAANPACALLDVARSNAKRGGYEPPHITKNGLRAMLADPDRCCALPSCGTKEDLCLEHDHKTGKVRGWVCGVHNRGMGLLGDDPQLLREAACYLEASRG